MRMVALNLLMEAVGFAGVRWREVQTLDQVLKQAEREGKLVAIDVFATWCGPCHEMDRSVYSQEEVATALDEHFIPIRVDGEQGIGENIVERYRVTGYPTFLILNADGNEVDRLMGVFTPKEFVQALGDRRVGRGTIAQLETQLRNNPTDLELVFVIGQRYAFRGERQGAEWYLHTVLREDTDNRRGLASKALHLLGKFLYVRGVKDYRKGIEALGKLRRKYPKSPEAQDTAESLARAWWRLGRPDRAREVLDKYLAAGPTESRRHNLYGWFCYKQGFDRLRGLEVAAQGLAAVPNDDGLWDTMAELYFSIGCRSQAIACERRAIALNAAEEYYVQQLKRFETAALGGMLPIH